MRPEFAQLRDQSLSRRAGADFNHILVSMGGVDSDDATSQVLDVLSKSPLPVGCHITVVMGRNAPWLDCVRHHARSMPFQTDVVVDVADMASLMVSADLAIGGQAAHLGNGVASVCRASCWCWRTIRHLLRARWMT